MVSEVSVHGQVILLLWAEVRQDLVWRGGGRRLLPDGSEAAEHKGEIQKGRPGDLHSPWAISHDPRPVNTPILIHQGITTAEVRAP